MAKKLEPQGHGIQYGKTPWVCMDLGEDKKPRFALYNTETNEIKKKSNNPNEFDTILREELHVWA